MAEKDFPRRESFHIVDADLKVQENTGKFHGKHQDL